MAWNTQQTKSLSTDAKGLENQSVKSSGLSAGAPVAFDASRAGRPYKDGWDMQRAYREGMQKVTWVFRCIDAIAGNQARLPIILRANNNNNGEVIRENNRILDLLNSRANDGEDSFIFRYRLSSQLLMSTRGVFVEKIRGRNGELTALHLLPPQHTAPIPDPKRFVSGYEVDMPNGTKVRVKAEDVIWIRRPHPLDPYLSLTPMEAAGVAIEIENLAKIYNRNFLVNDGRPGGLLVVRGDMDDDDKDELKSRFRGNINRTGGTTVIASEDGVDFVDTGASPRDAAYSQMRQITKEEILAAFGVPESVIGNAAGRTFSNAGEEIKVFWMETMLPHLEPIARAFDSLHPQYYLDFDTTDVPALILAKQEREGHLLQEFSSGLISANEYRMHTGRKRVESDLMDSMLANPNLAPIGNTEKAMENQQAGGAQAPGGTVMEQAVQAGAVPGAAMQGAPGAAPQQMPGMPPAQEAPPAVEPGMGYTPPETQAAPLPEGQLSADNGAMRFKGADTPFSDFEIKAEESADRWVEIVDAKLDRLFERQERVILEKALGQKSRKLMAGGTFDVNSVFDRKVWDRQIDEDLRPVLRSIVEDAAREARNEYPAASEQISQQELDEYLNAQITRVQQINETTREEIAAAILVAMAIKDSDERSALLRAALIAIFAYIMNKRKRLIAEHEAQTAYNAGLYFIGKEEDGKSTFEKRWITRRDVSVRPEHRALDGKSVALGNSFIDGSDILRFPGDPLAPPGMTINCRCRLSIRRR